MSCSAIRKQKYTDSTLLEPTEAGKFEAVAITFKMDAKKNDPGGVMNSSIAPIGIARRMILAIVTSREIYPGNFKWFHRAKLFRGFKR